MVDEKPNLPEGTNKTRAIVGRDDEMTPAELAEFEEEMKRGRAEIAAGRGIPVDELLVRVRQS